MKMVRDENNLQSPYSVFFPFNFMPGETRIDRAIGNEHIPNNTIFNITLTAKLARISGSSPASPKYLQFYYTGTYPIQAGDGSLDLRVPPLGCRYHIALDNTIDWEFRHDPNLPDPGDYSNDAMTLGQGVPSAYYPRLFHIGTQEIWFDALYMPVAQPGDPAAMHPFSLYVSLTLQNGAAPILLKIDPDILNPGDHTHPLTFGRNPRGQKPETPVEK
jgi:hypothetical protein